jgi:hypothetical protein
MTLASTVSSARSRDQRRSNASRSMWSGAVKAAMCTATGSAHCSNSSGRSSYLPQREPHSDGVLAIAEHRRLGRAKTSARPRDVRDAEDEPSLRRVRPLLDTPVELVLPAHGEPTDRTILERLLS